jgi:hypothetical protein
VGVSPARSSSPIPETDQLAFRPQDILMCSATALVFSLQHSVKLFEIRQRRFVIIGPAFVLRTLRLETPGSAGLDDPDFSLSSIFVPVYPGMAVMHSLQL